MPARLIKVSQDFASSVFPSCLFVVHDATTAGKDDVTKLTGGQQVLGPVFQVIHFDVEARRDNATLVKPSVQLNDDFSGTVIIYDFKFTNVSVSLHNREEFYNDFGGRTDEDLTLSAFLGIIDAFQAIVLFISSKSLTRGGITSTEIRTMAST